MANMLAAEVTLSLLGHQGEMWLFSSLILGVRKREVSTGGYANLACPLPAPSKS